MEAWNQYMGCLHIIVVAVLLLPVCCYYFSYLISRLRRVKYCTSCGASDGLIWEMLVLVLTVQVIN